MSTPTQQTASGMRRPVIYGEVLFDTFPDGQAVLGGAPFNVAWHLQGFGFAPLMISAVGDDAEGRRVLEQMRAWDMDTGSIQVLPAYPTGKVMVSLHHGQPGYDILTGQAYDHIGTVAADTLNDTSLLYHGSLIERSVESRSSLHSLCNRLHLPVFMDINLRAPWWEEQRLESAMHKARWLKMNDEELARLSGENVRDPKALAAIGQSWCREHRLELLVITRGQHGAICVTPDEIHAAAPTPLARLVDTVGAGDAFSAVTLAGLLRNWPLPVLLKRALSFASAICGIRGATSMDHALYQKHLQEWI